MGASACSGSKDGSGERCGLRFGLLGSPALYYDVSGRGRSEARDVASPKSRVLLAALLLDAGRVVSVESLKEALWGGAPPVSAQASLHNHVARLRRLLDEREEARARRDFDRADAIREELASRGFEVRDTADGAKLVRRA
jgi:hypothetical protein